MREFSCVPGPAEDFEFDDHDRIFLKELCKPELSPLDMMFSTVADHIPPEIRAAAAPSLDVRGVYWPFTALPDATPLTPDQF